MELPTRGRSNLNIGRIGYVNVYGLLVWTRATKYFFDIESQNTNLISPCEVTLRQDRKSPAR